MPNVPVPVWEQISIVIVFSFLIAGLGWAMFRLAGQAFENANQVFGRELSNSNQQWQRYCDARLDGFNTLNQQMLDRLDEFTKVLRNLRFEPAMKQAQDHKPERKSRARAVSRQGNL